MTVECMHAAHQHFLLGSGKESSVCESTSLHELGRGASTAQSGVLSLHSQSGKATYAPPHVVDFHVILYALKKLNQEADADLILGRQRVGEYAIMAPEGSFSCSQRASGQDKDGIPNRNDRTLFAKTSGFAPLIMVSSSPKAEGQDEQNWPSVFGCEVGVDVKLSYVQTCGPRFETRSEIQTYATLGHIVGMTCASEWTLAQEYLDHKGDIAEVYSEEWKWGGEEERMCGSRSDETEERIQGMEREEDRRGRMKEAIRRVGYEEDTIGKEGRFSKNLLLIFHLALPLPPPEALKESGDQEARRVMKVLVGKDGVRGMTGLVLVVYDLIRTSSYQLQRSVSSFQESSTVSMPLRHEGTLRSYLFKHHLLFLALLVHVFPPCTPRLIDISLSSSFSSPSHVYSVTHILLPGSLTISSCAYSLVTTVPLPPSILTFPPSPASSPHLLHEADQLLLLLAGHLSDAPCNEEVSGRIKIARDRRGGAGRHAEMQPKRAKRVSGNGEGEKQKNKRKQDAQRVVLGEEEEEEEDQGEEERECVCKCLGRAKGRRYISPVLLLVCRLLASLTMSFHESTGTYHAPARR
eukprot:756069-Hanusia_phi.AAC.1